MHSGGVLTYGRPYWLSHVSPRFTSQFLDLVLSSVFPCFLNLYTTSHRCQATCRGLRTEATEKEGLPVTGTTGETATRARTLTSVGPDATEILAMSAIGPRHPKNTMTTAIATGTKTGDAGRMSRTGNVRATGTVTETERMGVDATRMTEGTKEATTGDVTATTGIEILGVPNHRVVLLPLARTRPNQGLNPARVRALPRRKTRRSLTSHPRGYSLRRRKRWSMATARRLC